MNDDATGLPAAMLGLAGFEVLAAGEYGGELELLVQTSDTVVGCPVCGVVATAHGRRTHLVRDVAAGDRPVLLVWRKRLWRCREPACPDGNEHVGVRFRSGQQDQPVTPLRAGVEQASRR